MDTSNLIYKIFRDSLNNGSLPKYIFFRCTESSLCEYVKSNSSTTNRKLLRYLKKLKEQKLESYLKHSEIIYFDKLFNETVDINSPDREKQFKSLIAESYSSLFYVSDFDNIDALIEEGFMLLVNQFVNSETSITQAQLLKTIRDLSKHYNITNNFNDFDDLLFLLESWNRNNTEAINKIEDGLFRIEEVNKILAEYETLSMSELVYRQITYTASIKSYVQVEGTVMNYSLNRFSKEEYIWLFDSFVINNKLSIVQYNQESADVVLKYIKFDNKNLKLIDSLKTTISRNSKGQYIYSYITKLEPDNKYSYLTITMLLVPSILEFKIDTSDEEVTESLNTDLASAALSVPQGADKEIINTLSQNTPIIVGEVIETKLSATFRIFGITIDNTIFVDMLLNDDIMNTYLYLDERVTFWSEKKRLILHMKSIEYTYLNTKDEREDVSTELIAMITQVESDKLIRFKLRNSEEVVKIEAGDTYLEVNIIRSISRVAINRFYELISKLLNYYIQNRELVEKEYHKIFPNMKFAKFKEGRKATYQRKGTAKQKAKREILKFYAPDVFITGSPRLCQKNRQPIVLETEEDIAEFETRTFAYKDTRRNREVLQFPKDSPKYNFGCDYERLPFIGVKKSNLRNSDQYPYIPCCFEKPQMDIGIKSAYNDYYRTEDFLTKNQSNKSKHILITDKLVEYESFGYVNRKLENLFNKFFEPDTLLRFGVVRSNNSLLHCILIAIKDQHYLELKDIDERELYVRDMKLLIFNDMNYGLGKQEMYDYSEGEMYQYLLSDNIFLDPKLTYRYLEEYFQINIFTFKYKRNLETNVMDVDLEIPRHKLFYAKTLNIDRPTVLILKNSEKLHDTTTVACELLIVSKYTDINEATVIFGSEITEHLFTIFRYVNSTKIWGFSESMYELDDAFLYQDFKLQTAKERETASDREAVTKERATSVDSKYVFQFIDENGKRFGYVLETNGTNEVSKVNGVNRTSATSKTQITVMTPPTVPLDLPISNYDLQFPTYEQVLKVFDNPSSYSIDDSGAIDGLWFNDNSFWTPIVKVEKLNKFFSFLKQGPKQSYFIKNLKFIEKTHEKRIILSVIMNTIIKIIQITNIYDTEMFFEEYIQLNTSKLREYKLNSSFFTNMFVISHVKPYLEAVDTIVTNLITDDKLQIYDKKLYYDLIYFTNLYVKNNLVTFKEWKPNVMDFYKYEENFSVSNFVKVIIGEDKLFNWIYFEITKKNRDIYNRILLDDFVLILFHNEIIDKYYIIQKAKSIIQAVNICDLWITQGVNNGLDTTDEQFDINYDSFESYQVTLFGELETIPSKKTRSSYKLLFKGEFVYAILELP